MKLYGLTGYPLTHSFSQKFFTEKFAKENLQDCVYQNFEIKDISQIRILLGNKTELQGFNITIPHKKGIIKYVDDCNEVVQKINACNCIKVVNGKWKGYNTDVVGFEKSFIAKLRPHNNKALILGTGGSSKAVEFVLRKLNIETLFVSTSKQDKGFISYDELNRDILKEFTVIINTTPVGQFPNSDDSPAIPFSFITDKHYFFDLIYNPSNTLFLQLAKEKGALIQNGYDMLITQAEESWKIWNDDSY